MHQRFTLLAYQMVAHLIHVSYEVMYVSFTLDIIAIFIKTLNTTPSNPHKFVWTLLRSIFMLKVSHIHVYSRGLSALHLSIYRQNHFQTRKIVPPNLLLLKWTSAIYLIYCLLLDLWEYCLSCESLYSKLCSMHNFRIPCLILC